MSIRLGINGFGRIGRLLVRALSNHPELELVHINEPKGGVDCAAHLLEFDTVHGRFDGDVSCTADALEINGRTVGFSAKNSTRWFFHQETTRVATTRGSTSQTRLLG